MVHMHGLIGYVANVFYAVHKDKFVHVDKSALLTSADQHCKLWFNLKMFDNTYF